MILFKNRADTMRGVIENQMHATDSKPRRIKKGEIILIAQTKNTLAKGQKSIRWIMNFVSCEEDINNESDRIWGRHWKYIIRGENLRPVEPFDIEDIQVSKKNYDAIVVHGPVDKNDEDEILKWIDEDVDRKLDDEDKEDLADEFTDKNSKNYDEIIKQADAKLKNRPEYIERLVKLIKRPSALSNAIKQKYGYECKICKYPGFEKKGGGKYAEVHHMWELNKRAPRTLQSWNIIVVCPLCHKKLHYGKVKTIFLNPGWEIDFEGKKLIFLE